VRDTDLTALLRPDRALSMITHSDEGTVVRCLPVLPCGQAAFAPELSICTASMIRVALISLIGRLAAVRVVERLLCALVAA
jgi:hypothetical protein